MELKTEPEARNVSDLLGKQVVFGAIFCNRYRQILCKKGFKKSDQNSDSVHQSLSSDDDEDETFVEGERKSEDKTL